MRTKTTLRMAAPMAVALLALALAPGRARAQEGPAAEEPTGFATDGIAAKLAGADRHFGFIMGPWKNQGSTHAVAEAVEGGGVRVCYRTVVGVDAPVKLDLEETVTLDASLRITKATAHLVIAALGEKARHMEVTVTPVEGAASGPHRWERVTSREQEDGSRLEEERKTATADLSAFTVTDGLLQLVLPHLDWGAGKAPQPSRPVAFLHLPSGNVTAATLTRQGAETIEVRGARHDATVVRLAREGGHESRFWIADGRVLRIAETGQPSRLLAAANAEEAKADLPRPAETEDQKAARAVFEKFLTGNGAGDAALLRETIDIAGLHKHLLDVGDAAGALPFDQFEKEFVEKLVARAQQTMTARGMTADQVRVGVRQMATMCEALVEGDRASVNAGGMPRPIILRRREKGWLVDYPGSYGF